MPADFYLGLDLGTTGCKTLLLSGDGRVLGSASRTVDTALPAPGRAEQDPEGIWRHAAEATREVLARHGGGGRVAGMSICGAMHSLLPVGADDRPLAPASIWSDHRATAEAAELRGRTDSQTLYRRTGCPVRALYHPARLAWWRQHGPDIWAGARRFVAIKDFVVHRLTGSWWTDASLASTTGLLDTQRQTWDGMALDLAGFEPERLPALVLPTQVAGTLTPDAARATGLPPGLPVVAGGSDGALANFGATGARVGALVVTIGTSGAVRLTTDRPMLDSRERTWCYLMLPTRWIAGGAINNGGLAVDWVARTFYGPSPMDATPSLMREARQIPPGAEGLVALPYFTGDRNPHWEPEARAALLGMTLHHSRAHVARAVLEGVAFTLADIWRALFEEGEAPPAAQLTGGVVRSPAWCQILADVLGVRLAASEAGDASAVGAARLARMVLAGEPVEAAEGFCADIVQYEPDPAQRRRYRELHARFQSLAATHVFASSPPLRSPPE